MTAMATAKTRRECPYNCYRNNIPREQSLAGSDVNALENATPSKPKAWAGLEQPE